MRRPPFLAVFQFSGDVFIVPQGHSPVERPGLSTVLAMQTETRYADSGGVNIAYQTLGKGPQDLVLVHGWASNIEIYHEACVRAFCIATHLVCALDPVRQARNRSLGPGWGYAESRGSHGRRARRGGRRGFRTRSAFRHI